MRIAFCTVCAAILTVILSGCYDMSPSQELVMLQLNDPQEVSDMSVTQLIERMHDATDPKNKWTNCKAYIMRQSVRLEMKQGFSRVEKYYSTEKKFRRVNQKDAMLRQTSLIDGEPILTLIFRDGKGWSIDKKGIATEYHPGELGMNLFQNYIGFSDPKATERDLFPSVEVGVVYIDGVRTYRMVCRCSDPKIAPYVKYIDSKTFLVNRLETIMIAGDGSKYLYSAKPLDYRWVNDVKIPMKTEVIVGGNSEEYVTDEFLIDPNIPDSDFELPESVKIDYGKTK